MTAADAARDRRVVILLRDRGAERITSDLIASIGGGSLVCDDMTSVANAVAEGAGAVLVMEEALLEREALTLRGVLERQPPWSALPVLVVSARGVDSPVAQWAERGLRNVILLERPIRIRVLMSALRTALGGRERQYELRDQIEALHASNRTLERHTTGLRLLADAAALVLAEADPDAMLKALFERIAAHAGIDVCASFAAEPETRTLRLAAAQGFSEDEQRALATVRYGEAVCGKAAERGLPILAADVQSSGEPMVAWLKSVGVNAYISFPLMADGRLLGTVSFGTRSRPGLSADDLEFLGTLARYVTLAHDRARLVGALRESDRRKDEFLATLAHELRNPLAPIRNALEIMKMAGTMPPAAAYASRVMERQLVQMVRIVDDLMDVSRVTAGKLELHLEHVAVGSVIGMAVDTARAAIEAASHAVTLDLPPEPLLVRGDPVRLVQVFTNLLNNAAKYTERGGRIVVAVRAAGTAAEVTVSDNGLGIEPQALTRIFEPFAQVDHSLERTRGGLGIGLTLAKRMVELHGGEIEAHSDGRGRGSRFTVRIPLAASRQHAGQPADAPLRSRAPPLRILIADDNRDAAHTLGMMLRTSGHDVRVVHDGAAAVREAAAFRPALAILDIGMPELNGYDAAAGIRAQGPAAIVLAALTGWGQDADRRRAKAAGFDHHFTKPVDLAALERLLTDVAAGRAARAAPHAELLPRG